MKIIYLDGGVEVELVVEGFMPTVDVTKTGVLLVLASDHTVQCAFAPGYWLRLIRT